MADNFPNVLGAQFQGLSRLPAHRQFGLVLGLAVVAGLAAAVLMWAKQPNFVDILSADQQRDFIEAKRALDRADIPHQVDARTRALQVPATDVVDAEAVLLDASLISDGSTGFEILRLNDELGLGASRFQENTRFMLALQGEIERSITQYVGARSARVLIATSPDTGFVRDRDPVTASVAVALPNARTLTPAQVAGISQFVANSVPRLEVANVAVIVNGQEVSGGGGDDAATLRSEQLDLKSTIEAGYRNTIRDILRPMLGPESMQTAVDANVDFTMTEMASEIYGSEEPAAVLSESIREDESSAGPVGGVPGALTNQPPAAGAVADDAGTAAGAATAADNGPQAVSRSSTRNFQNDRTISHIRQPGYSLVNLSISVLVDDREVVGEDGAVTREPRTPAELERISALVQSAVGFNEARGDSLTVENASFLQLEPITLAPAEPIWKQPWVLQIARYAAGGLGILMLVMLVVRPVLKSLAAMPPASRGAALGGGGGAALAVAGGGTAELMQSQHNPAAADAALGRARKVAAEDPQLVAQVVRRWMDDDGK
jgi:flagellar M-ring protein FliF